MVAGNPEYLGAARHFCAFRQSPQTQGAAIAQVDLAQDDLLLLLCEH